jgi:hypothetical protein
MWGLRSNLDPELLQARWVLGGIEPEQFVEIAVSALERGFGTTQRLVSSPYRRSRDTEMINKYLKKMENHATAEATRLGKSDHGKLRLIGTAIGIVVVILLALWMAYHP